MQISQEAGKLVLGFAPTVLMLTLRSAALKRPAMRALGVLTRRLGDGLVAKEEASRTRWFQSHYA
jgi:hypothetical protein